MGSLLGYLVLNQPRQRLSHWVQALSPLQELGAPQPMRVDGYFLAAEDRALLGLWFLDGDREAAMWVEHVARLAEISIIDPAQLSDPDRRALLEKLQGSDVCIEHGSAISEVLGDLVRRGRELRAAALAPARTITDRTLSSPAVAMSAEGPAARVHERAPSPSPPAAALMAQREAGAPAQRRREPEAALAAGTARGPLAASRDEIAAANELLADGARRPVGTRNDLAQELERTALECIDDPFALAYEASAPTVEAKVLRGARWMAAQITYLALERVRVSTVALPRVRDRVALALTFADATVTVIGTVTHQSDDLEAQHTGVATFELSLELGDADRARLAALLRRARSAFAQLRPASPRASRRFAMAWPITLATPRGSIRAELHDASSGGMFVAPLRELELSGALGFSMVTDDLLSSVAGRARVVRQLSPSEARQRGVRSGVGLAIVELSEAARLSWERFVGRARRRNARRILVCANGSRLEEISQSLGSAGYAVCGGTDPVSVLRLLELEAAPDAAVVDSEWVFGPDPGWFSDRLTSHGVRCLTTHGDGRRAYGEVDRLLGLA